jgi:hypothetical protein
MSREGCHSTEAEVSGESNREGMTVLDVRGVSLSQIEANWALGSALRRRCCASCAGAKLRCVATSDGAMKYCCQIRREGSPRDEGVGLGMRRGPRASKACRNEVSDDPTRPPRFPSQMKCRCVRGIKGSRSCVSALRSTPGYWGGFRSLPSMLGWVGVPYLGRLVRDRLARACRGGGIGPTEPLGTPSG